MCRFLIGIKLLSNAARTDKNSRLFSTPFFVVNQFPIYYRRQFRKVIRVPISMTIKVFTLYYVEL